MCGFCGFVGPNVSEHDYAAGPRMRETLRHRGPDGDGEAILDVRGGGPGLTGWMGHRRLKIIDLTEQAHQPMRSADGTVVLAYNGEVYNFRELRRELESRGHRFQSSGDTEVVLHSYEEWGEGFVDRMDGMFAIAVWDGRRRSLLMARDRTGKKPLFYTTVGGRLSFGSEIKSLLAAPWVRARLDVDRLPEFFTYGYVPAPNTIYAGIHQVPPASFVYYDDAGLRPPRLFWDPLPPEAPAPARPARDDLAALRRLMAAAVGRRLISDVPLGALLSGGVDSSIVVGLMSRASSDPIRTFSIGFPDDASFDERGYARQVADHFGTSHTEFAVRADAVGLLDRLLWHHDQPFADDSAIPTYLVSQLAREEVTVALNGDGGDEIFGGYGRFAAVSVTERLPSVLQLVARQAARALPTSSAYFSPRRRIERLTQAAGLPAHARYQSWISVLTPDLLGEVLRPLTERGLSLEGTAASMDACYARASHLPVLDQILYANFRTYLPDDLAVKMDRMSMAHGLETRSPFLDTALIEAAAGIAARRKVGILRLKPLLRRAFWPLLPRTIWNRPKHGFSVPVAHWFRHGDLGTMFEDEVLGAGALCEQYLSREAVTSLWREHRSGEAEHGRRLWTILAFERWLRTCGRQTVVPPAVALSA
jgi:asparagine synthase (glutamine-hydrolysing)